MTHKDSTPPLHAIGAKLGLALGICGCLAGIYFGFIAS